MLAPSDDQLLRWMPRPFLTRLYPRRNPSTADDWLPTTWSGTYEAVLQHMGDQAAQPGRAHGLVQKV